MEKCSASCIVKEMNITTPMRSLSRLDWFVSLLINVLMRSEEIRIFIKNGYRFLEGNLTVTIKFNTNAWSRTNIFIFLTTRIPSSFILQKSRHSGEEWMHAFASWPPWNQKRKESTDCYHYKKYFYRREEELSTLFVRPGLKERGQTPGSF